MDSKSKLYSYRVSINPVMDSFMRLFRTHVYYDVDMDLLREALELFVGTHDFRAFSGQVSNDFLRSSPTTSLASIRICV